MRVTVFFFPTQMLQSFTLRIALSFSLWVLLKLSISYHKLSPFKSLQIFSRESEIEFVFLEDEFWAASKKSTESDSTNSKSGDWFTKNPGWFFRKIQESDPLHASRAASSLCFCRYRHCNSVLQCRSFRFSAGAAWWSPLSSGDESVHSIGFDDPDAESFVRNSPWRIVRTGEFGGESPAGIEEEEPEDCRYWWRRIRRKPSRGPFDWERR